MVYFHPQACLPPDAYGYLALAKNLSTYQVFAQGISPVLTLETFRLPGYPLFLAPFIFLFSSPVLWVAFAQCVIGALTAFLMWFWLRSMTDERGALAGSLVLALDVVVLLHTPMVLTETLVTLLTTIALIQTWRTLRSPGTREMIACGLLWGITMMVKPVFLLFPWVLCWIWSMNKKRMLAFLLAAYLLPGAWVVRNGLKAHFWGLSSQSGFALLAYPAASVEAASTGRPWETVKRELQAKVDAAHPSGYRNDAEQSQAHGDAAVRILKLHPVLLMKYCLMGTIRILAGTGAGSWYFYLPLALPSNDGWSVRALWQQTVALLRTYPWLLPIQLLYAVGLAAFYVLSVWGWLRWCRLNRRTEAYILAAGALYLLLMASHQGSSRFRIPMMPFMAAAFAFYFSKTPSSNPKP